MQKPGKNVFVQRGVKPNLYILDNEISGELKTALAKNESDYQLTPPHIHRRNTAERAIRTFKIISWLALHPVTKTYL